MNLTQVYKIDNFIIQEPSYMDYKHMVKGMLTNDLETLNFVFNNILEFVKNKKSIDKLSNKIVGLLHIRSLILGNDIKLRYKNKNINTNINNIIKNLPKTEKSIKLDNLTFTLPNTFLVNNWDIEDIAKCLKSVDIENNYHYILDKPVDEKIKLLESLDFNLYLLISTFQKEISLYTYNFLDLSLNLFTGDFLYFLKSIFYTDIEAMYKFELFLIKNLNLNTYDLNHLSYSDLLVHYNNTCDELSEKEQVT